MSVKLRVSEDHPSTHGAFLVTFSNGQLQPSSRNPLKFTLYQKSSDRTKRRRIMVAETDQMAYVGTNYGANSLGQGRNLCRYYIGAVSRETQTLSLVQAEPFCLSPHIPGRTDVDFSQQSPSKTERAEAATQLVDSFGSERQKRAYAASRRNRVGASALDTALAGAIEHAQTSAEGAKAAVSAQSSGVLPAHDPGAERPQDVYDLHSIISLDEFKALKKPSKTFCRATSADVSKWRAEETYCGYVLQHLSSLPSSEPDRTLKASILLYISFLVKMYQTSPRAFEEHGLQFSGVAPPPVVREQLLSRFTERREGEDGQAKYGLSRLTKNKALSHLLVLALVIDDFTIESSTLQRDLHVTARILTDHFQALGCVVSKAPTKRKSVSASPSPSSFTATLRIPLNFPKPKKNRKSK